MPPSCDQEIRLSARCDKLLFVKRVALLFGIALVLGVAAASSRPTDFVIVAAGQDDQRRIGSYHYLRDFGRGRSYAAAVRTFGRPTSRGTDAPGSNLCTVRWRDLGVDVGFASRPGACRPGNLRDAAWYGASVHSRRWSTNRRLRIGDNVARLRRLYPRARFRDTPPVDPYWSLLRERGEFGVVDALTAIVWDGRVVSFEIPANYVY